MVQKTVGRYFPSGLVGEIATTNGAIWANPASFDSDDETNNIAGRVFTYKDADKGIVQAGGDGVIAGIFVRPKELPNYGEFLDPISNSPFVINGLVGQFLQFGIFWGAIDVASSPIGSKIGYKKDTGELVVVADASSLPTGVLLIDNCSITRETSSSETPSLACIKIALA